MKYILIFFAISPLTIGLFAEELDALSAMITKKKRKRAATKIKRFEIDERLVRLSAYDEFSRKCKVKSDNNANAYLTVEDIENLANELKNRKALK